MSSMALDFQKQFQILDSLESGKTKYTFGLLGYLYEFLDFLLEIRLVYLYRTFIKDYDNYISTIHMLNFEAIEEGYKYSSHFLNFVESYQARLQKEIPKSSVERKLQSTLLEFLDCFLQTHSILKKLYEADQTVIQDIKNSASEMSEGKSFTMEEVFQD
jgi:hypothetical protein